MTARFFVLGSLFSSSLALASGPPATATLGDALVDVAWSDGHGHATRYSLALPGDKSCSSLEMQADKSEVRLAICRDGGDEAAPLLNVDLQRVDRSAATLASKLHAVVRLRRGGTMSMGRFQRADQPEDVTVSLR